MLTAVTILALTLGTLLGKTPVTMLAMMVVMIGADLRAETIVGMVMTMTRTRQVVRYSWAKRAKSTESQTS